MRAASRRARPPCLLHGFAAPTLVLQSVGGAFDFGKADDAYGFYETLDIARDQKPLSCRLTLVESSTAGNIFHRDDTTVFTRQIENLTDGPLQATGKVDMVRDGALGRPGEMWVPDMPRKHFSLRQRPHPKEGLVQAGGSATEHEGNPRIVEAALPGRRFVMSKAVWRQVTPRSSPSASTTILEGRPWRRPGTAAPLSPPAGHATRTGSTNRSRHSRNRAGRVGTA